ncbi:MAG: hypothetical protein KGP28_03495 [Bdellovibrionales bacterium]|nr:hypothetical protein [Bdellovibrionales bacterium]
MKPAAAPAWIHSPLIDSLFILGPGVLTSALAWWFRDSWGDGAGIPPWAWMVFVLGIDVSHVYSTLFRTYLDPVEIRERGAILILAPLLAWITGVFLYSLDGLWFWRALAYLAVFHFIRQQYGFLMLYLRNAAPETLRFIRIDQLLLYHSMIHPLIHWHASPTRNFQWFIQGDFLAILPPVLERISLGLYLLLLLAYGVKEILLLRKGHALLVPKQLILAGTALSWFTGIVWMNGDMAFTVTNVASHGIPYLALIWIFGNRRASRPSGGNPEFHLGKLFKPALLPVFAGALFLAAYLEEGLWAGLVWREHFDFLGLFSALPRLEDRATLAWIIPLLALPQATHYILDGFIWRIRDQKSPVRETLFADEGGVA